MHSYQIIYQLDKELLESSAQIDALVGSGWPDPNQSRSGPGLSGIGESGRGGAVGSGPYGPAPNWCVVVIRRGCGLIWVVGAGAGPATGRGCVGLTDRPHHQIQQVHLPQWAL